MAKASARKKSRTGLPEPSVTRDIDPNVLQRRAAGPGASVWVDASAGSGKTKVLTDRVLRLLLPGKNRAGTKPHKILGITFTKAAAGEMRLRLNKILSRWAVAAEEDLLKELDTLLGAKPSTDEIQAARRLFADVTDAPGGLQIMTIHSFCQSVLGRFPLEAGLPPHFAVLEERAAKAMLAQARDAVLKAAANAKTSPLGRAVHHIGGAVNDDQFLELLENLSRERYQLRQGLEKHFGPDGAYTELCRTLKIPPGRTPENIMEEACKDSAFAAKEIRTACMYLRDSKIESDKNLGESILHWLDNIQARTEKFPAYSLLYLTKEGTIRKKKPSKSFHDNFPESVRTLHEEAARIIELIDKMNAAGCALLTRDLFTLGEKILDHYAELKSNRGVLDFDDLITYTLKLLQKTNMAGWVLYKLDQGLDHILIDEAQDTNPEQWRIIEALCNEFMAGIGARDITRTVFTVGDEKQSIYSFQRAAPEEFRRMHENFEKRVKDAGENWENVDLNISFRSTESVLRAVDATFPENTHHAFRRGQAGLAELWPLCDTAEDETPDAWEPPVRIIESQSGAVNLANQIAREIKTWLDKKEILPSRGRPIRPEDILILVRTRNAFFQQLSRALKTYDIPVSGVDRMILGEQLAVQDILAAAEFALLPQDDLTLAALLKSPLIGWDDEKLYAAAAERTGALWDSVKSKYRIEKDYLEALIHSAGVQHPYEFFEQILKSPCPADETSGARAFKKRLGPDSTDPLEELLSAALIFEQDNIASLQGFLHWQSRSDAGIKREMEEARGEVRIMTVHGAKGLQAPIVILPDTVRTGGPAHADTKLLWPDKSGLAVPLWCPRADLEFSTFTAAKERIMEKAEAEYQRLLYVAMTRAEDRLYVCGYTGKKTSQKDHWYESVKTGFEKLDDKKVFENGRMRIDNPQIHDADKPDITTGKEIKDSAPPAWLFKPAPPEPLPPKPLIPSRPSESESPVLSPLTNDDTYRFRRGSLTHKLLELLPEISKESRENTAKTFVARYATDIPQKIRDSVIEETLKVLNHPEFNILFGPGSQAEVPITGLTKDGRVISGQVDRLLITGKEIFIIDYKTNRPPPKNQADVPAIYISQMKAYAETLEAIYPGRAVHSALLWTDGPFLMPLNI